MIIAKSYPVRPGKKTQLQLAPQNRIVILDQFKLDGRVSLVTGASTGPGRPIAMNDHVPPVFI